jgi:hypothetical protein
MPTLRARTVVSGLLVAALALPVSVLTEASAHASKERVAAHEGAKPLMQVPAHIAVSVAQIWVSPKSPRAIDRRMLSNPVAVKSWVQSLDFHGRLGLHGRASTQALMGDPVVVMRTRKGWSEVRVVNQFGSMFPNGIPGWLPSRLISTTPLPVTRRMVSVTSRRAPLRRLGQSGRAVGPELSYATQLPYAGSMPHRVRVYVPGHSEPRWLPRRDVSVHAATKPSISPTRRHVVHEFMQFRGLQFLWAGTSSFGFDCAGIVSTVYTQFGVHLARDAADQALQGKPITVDHLRPGDVVFFSSNHTWAGIHHAAVYIGHGRIVQSPHTGAAVSTAVLQGYDGTQYWGARRYIH